MKKKICVIVNGFSTGKLLQPKLNERGYDCIHLITDKKFYSKYLDNDTNKYLNTIFLEESFGNTLKELKKYNIQCIIPGIEGNSVLVADKLNATLNLPGNTLALSESRRNKYLMSKVLEKKHLQSISSITISSIDELITKHKKIDSFPKVIKPESAGGSQDVHICSNEKEMIDAFNTATGRINECGVKNQSMIIQPYIKGQEYFINTTSCQGRHYVNDIWIYFKTISSNSEPICHGSKLLDNNGESQDIITPFCFAALDALGIKNGPAHIEIILQGDQPYFIELGARLMGGAIDNTIFENSVEYTQLDATIDCFLAPNMFLKKIKQPYKLKKQLEFININADKSGNFKFRPLHTKLKTLSSYVNDVWLVKDGQYVKKTVDDLTSIGLIILQHKDSTVIQKDKQYIKSNLDNIFSII